MKIAIAYLFLVFLALGAKGQCKTFEIKIRDSDYSAAVSKLVRITPTKLSITYIGLLVGEKDTLVYHRTIDNNICSLFSKRLSVIKFDTLKSAYIDDTIDDGYQLSAFLRLGKKEKRIQISNWYQEDIEGLIAEINTLIPKKFKFSSCFK